MIVGDCAREVKDVSDKTGVEKADVEVVIPVAVVVGVCVGSAFNVSDVEELFAIVTLVSIDVSATE